MLLFVLVMYDKYLYLNITGNRKYSSSRFVQKYVMLHALINTYYIQLMFNYDFIIIII